MGMRPAAVLLLLLVGCRPANTGVIELSDHVDATFRQLPYPVEGETFAGLMRSIDERAPTFQGRVRPSWSEVSFTWNYYRHWDVSHCYATSAVIHLHVEQWYPRWDPPFTPSPPVKQQWLQFVELRRSYEDRRVAVAVDVAERIAGSMLAAKSERACDDLQQTMERITADGAVELTRELAAFAQTDP